MFPFEEYPVTDFKLNTDVHFPGAACLIVSCKTDPIATKKELVYIIIFNYLSEMSSPL